MQELGTKIKESLESVLPISLIVIILSFTPLFSMTSREYIVFIIATIFLIFGISLFNLGADMAMQPIGEQVGSGLSKNKKIGILITVVFLLGCLITIAEPDLSVLAEQVATINGTLLKICVSIGVGILLIVSVLRMIFQKSLSYILMLFYMIAFAFALLVTLNGKTFLLPVSFDSGGVTTGPITVPFIMALGVGISNVIGGSKAKENSFGLVALSSIGPIIMVLVLSLFSKGNLDYTLPEGYIMKENILRSVGIAILSTFKEVLISIGLIVIFFICCQIIFLKLPKKKIKKIAFGIIYTVIGLVMFLASATIAYMPIGYKLGSSLANVNKYILIPFGLLIGAVVVFAEPAIRVLTHQVEEITGGYISNKQMLFGLAIGVSLALGLSMVRIIFDFNIMYYLVPGYIISLSLSLFVPPIYTAIAFDSGGVASGPMASSFILPFAVGACSIIQGEQAILNDAFGIVAMVALAPLITIQLLGFKAITSNRIHEKYAMRILLDEDDAQIINF